MTPVKLIQPVYFALVHRTTLKGTYPLVCASMGLKPIDQGYGIMLGIKSDLSRVTMISAHPDIVVSLYASTPRDREGVQIPDGAFPLARDAWVDLPPAAILGSVGRVAVLGPPDHGLGATRPVHSVTYFEHGHEVAVGYARGDELDAWRADLDAEGWVVDDREAVKTPACSACYGAGCPACGGTP